MDTGLSSPGILVSVQAPLFRTLPRWLPEAISCCRRKLVDQRSAESDKEKRKRLVWEIERRLAEDGAWPVIFNPDKQRAGTRK